MKLKSLQSLDWRSIQGKLSSQSANDFNHFLEKLPVNTSKTLLIIIGVVWAGAATMGLYASVQARALTELRAELADAESMQPTVPQIKNATVQKQEIEPFVAAMSEIYKGLTIKSVNAGIAIEADSTSRFGQFREAIGHVENGDRQWKVHVDKMCVGRECGRTPLMVTLKIAKVDVQM